MEVHPDPDQAWSDGEQSLSFTQFDDLMGDIAPFLQIWSSRRQVAAHA